MKKLTLSLTAVFLSLALFTISLMAKEGAVLLPALSGLLVVLLGTGIFYHLFPRPGLYPLLGLHFSLGTLVMVLPAMQRMTGLAYLGSVALILLPPMLFHSAWMISETFLESQKYRFTIMGIYLVSLILLPVYLFVLLVLPLVWIPMTYALQVYVVVIYGLWIWHLIRIIKHPHLELDRLHARYLMTGQVVLWIIPCAVVIAITISGVILSDIHLAPLAVLFPIALGAGLIPSHRIRKDTYVVQSEKRSTFSNLLSGLSHELNNPMTFIQSNLTPMRESVALIEKSVPQLDDKLKRSFEKLQRMIDHVEEGVRRSREVVKSFEQFPNQKVESKEEIDLHEILDGCIEVLSPRWKDRVQIEKSYGESSPLKGYRRELEQAFTNLLANAFDATPDQGTVSVTTRKGAGGIKVVIKDTGPGIPADQMGKIFDPFFTTKEQGKGTGLGLAIALQLITNHKGTIQVKSKPSKGSEFTIFLPTD